VLALSACASAAGQGARGDSSAQAPTASAASPDTPDPGPARGRDQEPTTRVALTVAGQLFTATLDDSAASRDLLAQLPLTVAMTDHGGVEKTGRLPRSLSTAGQPDAGDASVGDIGYYAPGRDLVLYYGDQSSYPGIVVLGLMDRGAAEGLATLDGPVTTVVQATTG
jgi:hypothetical protein